MFMTLNFELNFVFYPNGRFENVMLLGHSLNYLVSLRGATVFDVVIPAISVERYVE